MENLNQVLLQETYYGKDQTLLDCENCITAMKQAINVGKNPNGIQEKTIFESLICKKFNCEKVYFSILADESGINAYTMPYFYEKNRNYKDEFFDLVTDSDGIHYKNSAGKILYIYTNVYTIRNFSVDSIMGILLHEIGHNFFFIKEQVHNRRAKAFTEFILWLLRIFDQYNYHPEIVKEGIAILINETLAFKKGVQANAYEQTKKLLTDKAFDIINGKYKKSHTGIGKAFYTLKVVASKVLSAGFKLLNNVIYTLFLPLLITSASYKKLTNAVKKTQDYNAEKFCDNFATSFGYGKGIVDSFANQQNFTYSRKIGSKIPIVRVLDYYSDMLMYLTTYMADEHPTDQKRCAFALEKLKHELKENRKNMSPKQIEELEKDIADVEKILKSVPTFKKVINAMFASIDDKRDAAGSIGITDEEIYDFDKTLLKDRVVSKNESAEIYMTENCYEAINEYFNTPLMETLNESYVV